MDRICLTIVFASILVLVTAIALIGPPQDERSRNLAAALEKRLLNQSETDEKMLVVAGLARLKSLERLTRSTEQ